VIYDGFKVAIQDGVPQEKAGMLVDEQFGSAILRNAAAHGYTTACSAEKAGRTNLISRMASSSLNTSRLSSQLSAKCWCVTTPRVTAT
jgi:hypothetical protein